MNKFFDRTDWGRIRLTGADRVRFLHNQTTNSIEQLSAGQGCHSVFVTSTGRTIDLATVYAFSDSLLTVVSPGMAQQLYDWMDRYIFFSDKVTLTDESEQTFMFTVVGETAEQVIKQLSYIDLGAALSDPFSHRTIDGKQGDGKQGDGKQGDGKQGLGLLTVAHNTDIATAGYTVWGDKENAETVKSALLAAGATEQSHEEWETLRIQQGRPMPSAELTDDDNPLEAGLWDSVSFSKGCYIGQETIARLNTYKGVKKRLWGLQLQAPLPEDVSPVGWAIKVQDSKVGRITSLNAAGDFGLGYVRTKAGGEALEVLLEGEQVEGKQTSVTAKTVAVPFLRHEYYSAEDTSAEDTSAEDTSAEDMSAEDVTAENTD